MSDATSFPWVEEAMKYKWTREVAGPEDNPDIEWFLEATSYDLPEHYTDEVPWCSGFVNRMMMEVGIRGTGLANAKSWLNWGKPVGCMVGAVVIFDRGGWKGHVGFVTEVVAETGEIWVVGGNQNNEVNETLYSTRRVVGYRMPVGWGG